MEISKDIADIRNEYTKGGLNRRDLLPDPVAQFTRWFEQICEARQHEPTAMILATADKAAQPTTRTVLLKAYDSRGFVFYTNFESTKARQMAENDRVSLLFPWFQLERQVIICGRASKISQTESLKYFMSRPFGSQIGAWVSQQSSRLSSRKVLELQWEKIKDKYKKGKVPLPSFWGGYRVAPVSVEFWQGRRNRLHDRFMYTRGENQQWNIERLAP